MALGDIIDRKVFTDVPNITGVKQVSCGEYYTILLMNDGTIKACGNNQYGQLGSNNTIRFITIPNITGVKQIACGQNHTMLLMDDGTIKACGDNC